MHVLLSVMNILSKVISAGKSHLFIQVTITCEYDISYFPYDTQNCSLRYSSWMYTASEIDPYATEPTDLTAYNENDGKISKILSQHLKGDPKR